ncbi:MAG: tetratricopeptide repeat protein [bacterium]
MNQFIKVGVVLTVMLAGGAASGVTAESGGQQAAASVLASYNEGLGLLKDGKQDAALAAFTRAARDGRRMTEPDVRAMVSSSAEKAGMILMEQGKLEQAEQMGYRAIVANTRNALAMNTLGLIFRRQGQDDLAVRWFKKAIGVDPKLVSSYQNLADMMMAKRDFANAAQYLTSALEADPSDVRLLISLAGVYERDSKPDLAEKVWKTLLQKTMDSPRAKLQLGGFYMRTGAFAKARPLFLEVASANPKLPEARLLLIRLLAREGKTSEAQKACRILLKDFPDDLTVRDELAALMSDAGARKEKKP